VRRAIIIACICLVVVLGGIALITKLFFARDFLQTVYGKANYARMSEKSVAQAIGNSTNTALDGLADTAAVQNKDHASVNQQKIAVSLDDNFKNYMHSEGNVNLSFLDELTTYVNSLNFQTTNNYNAGRTSTGLKISDGKGTLISATGSTDGADNGYYQLPGVSNTYIHTNGLAINLDSSSSLRNFKMDKKQMTASIGKLTKIMEDAIDGGKTSIVDSADISVEGVGVSAEKVTVTLDGDQLRDLSKNMIEDIRDDSYLYTFLSQNYKSLSESGDTSMFSALQELYGISGGIGDSGLSESNYKDFLNQLADYTDNIPDNVAGLSLSTYITPQNTTVAQNFEITLKNGDSTPGKIDLNYVIGKNGIAPTKALSVTVDGKEYFYMTQKADSAQNGNVVLMAQDPSSNQRVGLQIAYSGFKKDQFMGSPVYLGLFKNLTDSTVTVTNSLAGQKMSTVLDLSLSGIGELKLSQNTTEASSKKITLPDVNNSDTITVTKDGVGDGEYELTSQYQVKALKYISNLMKSHSDLSDILSNIGLSQEDIQEELGYN
jgi:hypothetical protein